MGRHPGLGRRPGAPHAALSGPDAPSDAPPPTEEGAQGRGRGRSRGPQGPAWDAPGGLLPFPSPGRCAPAATAGDAQRPHPQVPCAHADRHTQAHWSHARTHWCSRLLTLALAPSCPHRTWKPHFKHPCGPSQLAEALPPGPPHTHPCLLLSLERPAPACQIQAEPRATANSSRRWGPWVLFWVVSSS